MTLANVLLAADMVNLLLQRAMKFQAVLKQAASENRDLTDEELDAMADQAGTSLDLARRRLEGLRDAR